MEVPTRKGAHTQHMAWLLKCIALGKKQGIEMPDTEEKILTNFIR
jgi:hypothetical protein